MDFRKKANQQEQAVRAAQAAPTPLSSRTKKPHASLTKFRIITIVAVVFVLFSGFLTYKYIQINHQIKQLRNNPQQVVNNSTQKLVTRVGQLALLPQGQTPTIAMVKNVSQLKSQVFFTNAQNGDYLLVYAQSKKAILYRPSDNKIVEYANTN
jgi:hypothetical protein